MKQKPRTQYWCITGVERGLTYIPKEYSSTQLHVYTDRRKAEKQCVGKEKVVEIKIKIPN